MKPHRRQYRIVHRDEGFIAQRRRFGLIWLSVPIDQAGTTVVWNRIEDAVNQIEEDLARRLHIPIYEVLYYNKDGSWTGGPK